MIFLVIAIVWLGSLGLLVGLRVKATKAAEPRASRRAAVRAESAPPAYQSGPAVPLRS
jgi:hypothetical protein